MSTGWVAASVRARALSQRRLGAVAVRDLAARHDLDQALDVLADSPYSRDITHGQGLASAQHAVAATPLWHMRILAGWVPRGDARILRILAGGFEIANVDERVREIEGRPHEAAYRLGSLATSWASLSGASSVADLRQQLARSAWGDPGADTAAAVRLGMRLSWAARVAAGVPGAREWAAGAAALVVARAMLLEQSPIPAATAILTSPTLGTAWPEATNIRDLTDRVARPGRWALAGVERPVDLWRAEARWWARLNIDGMALLRRPITTPDPVLGAVAVLAADAWRVRGALEVAARGGASSAEVLEAFDAVA
jgi:hypothetical protein